MVSRLRQMLLFVIAVSVLGCLATPQPNPPNVLLDPAKVFTEPTNSNGVVGLEGWRGAVSPPEAALYLWDLDTYREPQLFLPESNGSFSVDFFAESGNELRLQAFYEDSASMPLDMRVDGSMILPAQRPLSGCLTADPPHTLSVTREGTQIVELRNDCDEPVAVEAIELRAPSDWLTVTSEPGSIAPGEVQDITIESSPVASQSLEVLLIEISEPAVDRRAVTLVDWGR